MEEARWEGDIGKEKVWSGFDRGLGLGVKDYKVGGRKKGGIKIVE